MARPKGLCPGCLLPPDECLGHDEEEADGIPAGGPDPEPYPVNEHAEGM